MLNVHSSLHAVNSYLNKEEQDTATHCSTLAWRVPQTEEPTGRKGSGTTERPHKQTKWFKKTHKQTKWFKKTHLTQYLTNSKQTNRKPRMHWFRSYWSWGPAGAPVTIHSLEPRSALMTRDASWDYLQGGKHRSKREETKALKPQSWNAKCFLPGASNPGRYSRFNTFSLPEAIT